MGEAKQERQNHTMRNMVDIDIVIDDKYIDPKVTIQTKEKTKQVENIVYAIENVIEKK